MKLIPPIGGFILLCYTQFIYMYLVQFWYGGNVCEWRGLGDSPYSDIDDARKRVRALREQCYDSVEFRVLQLSAP